MMDIKNNYEGIDAVIPMNQQSVWNNNELRFTLRSFEQTMPIRNVYLIGTKPLFIKNVIHLPFRDKSMYAATNICEKLKYACVQEEISEMFIYANDDHYLLPGFDIGAAYYDGDMEQQLRDHPDILYKKTIRNTLEYLLSMPGEPMYKNFDIHTPILLSKKSFLAAMAQINWSRPWGYCIKSMYGNIYGLPGVAALDGKVRGARTYDYLRGFIKDKVCLSSGNVINEDFKRLLTELYPNKSKYE